MSFFEVEFPRTISFKSTRGPGFNTTVNKGFSGFEQRNKNWSASRGQWALSLITPTAFQNNRLQFLQLLDAFLLNVSGMGDGFRLFDPLDNSAVNQLLGVGDSTTNTFQLVKKYIIGGRTYVRVVNKPIMSTVADYQGNALANTVVVYRAGVADPTNRWTVDATTGLVQFVQGVSHIAISAAVFTSGPNTTTYTYTLSSGAVLQVGMRIIITGMGHAGNNGTFYITALGSGTFTVINALGVTATEVGAGITDWTPKTGDQINADFGFHFPVRFDTDQMQIQVEESDVVGNSPIVSWNGINMVEIRIIAGASQG
jgi:uncharacterized protein (TIGR02217 family)